MTNKPNAKRWNELSVLAARVDPFAAATQAARLRTGDAAIGGQVSAGKTRIVRTIYPAGGGFATIEPLTGWLNHADALAFIETMGRKS